ncbi:hypothetical protein BST28_07380 [Mycolicibacter kumamotonensis]|uniref:Membrane transport protein MMPL domain-containing protein n=2 Tax=Mycobacteriaceae TaxID=1762 RepID=A0A1X1W6E6_MYCIR|nr:hypothetical protein BST28_07380 [Mycolicibacter kumamotonensis]ORV82187.1 hypothetical protein AWC12_00820 [Mycolicibacterium iranicum]
MATLLGPLARLSRRHAGLVVLAWIAVAAVANVLVPQLERVVEARSPSFMPTDAPSVIAADRSAALFDAPSSNNLVYVVLERRDPLQPADRRYYDALVTELRSDTEHVQAVTDLWSAPLSADAVQSKDRRAVNLMVRLTGLLGTAQASASVSAIREAAAELGPPAGLRVYVTGPGATLADEFAAVDRQMLLITAATVVVITLLLLVVYRSLVAIAIPLMAVGLTLAVAKAVVAALGNHGVLEVSLFTVALIAAMILGAGVDYAIFLIGRYHEGRRQGIEHEAALIASYRAVSPVIVASALTIAAGLSCLGLAQISMFRSIGLPCAIGILIVALAALTLTPALIQIAGRRGLLEPKRAVIARRWRRVGIMLARWPGPLFVVSAGLIIALTVPLIGMQVNWNEPAATPDDAESNLGYAAMDRHFPPNQLLPNVVTVEADHDLRNPAGLIAIERVTRQIMAIPGVRMVQSASRPAGTVPAEANLTYQAGMIGDQLNDAINSLTNRLNGVAGDLDAALAQVGAAVDQMGGAMAGGADGMREIGSAADGMRAGVDGLRDNLTVVSGYLDPLRNFKNGIPDCAVNPICSLVAKVVDPVDSLVRSSTDLSAGTVRLTAGSSTVTSALAAVPQTLQQMRGTLDQVQEATRGLRGAIGAISPQMRQLTDYLNEIDLNFEGSAAGGFYMPNRALEDPRFREALKALVSPDGHAALLLVFSRGQEWGVDGAHHAAQIQAAIDEATKEGTLTPLSVQQVGVGPTTHDLQALLRDDVILLAVVTVVLIFLIVAVMLRSPVAAVVVVGTVIVSYGSTLGVSVLIWQHVLGQPLHWIVAPIAFIALVAVGTDYNLLLAIRIREEAWAGINTGLIRAFAGTGGVVTTAGIIFGITMFAMLGSTVQSIAQMGSTIGIGLLLDTLIIRTVLMPSIVALLGRWFWWPNRVTAPRTGWSFRRKLATTQPPT